MTTDSTTPAALLRAAHQRIADAAHYCQRAHARDAAGQSVPTRERTAVAWNVEGALDHVAPSSTPDGAYGRAALLLADARQAVCPDAPRWYVQDAAHADALRIYARAIAAAETPA